jgi:hypothetical protein
MHALSRCDVRILSAKFKPVIGNAATRYDANRRVWRLGYAVLVRSLRVGQLRNVAAFVFHLSRRMCVVVGLKNGAFHDSKDQHRFSRPNGVI